MNQPLSLLHHLHVKNAEKALTNSHQKLKEYTTD